MFDLKFKNDILISKYDRYWSDGTFTQFTSKITLAIYGGKITKIDWVKVADEIKPIILKYGLMGNVQLNSYSNPTLIAKCEKENQKQLKEELFAYVTMKKLINECGS